MLTRSRGRRSIALLVMGACLASLVGCGDGGATPESSSGSNSATSVDVADSEFTSATGQKTVPVAVVDNTFEPSYLRVSPGTKLVFTNDGRNDHNVTPVEPRSFDAIPTENLGPGQVASVTVGGAGDYGFYCSIHGTKRLNGQSGVIRVVAA
jgi:plastocyanin